MWLEIIGARVLKWLTTTRMTVFIYKQMEKSAVDPKKHSEDVLISALGKSKFEVLLLYVLNEYVFFNALFNYFYNTDVLGQDAKKQNHLTSLQLMYLQLLTNQKWQLR